MSEHVEIKDSGPVRTVRMNRPDKKNALTAAMYDAMAGALESANGHPDIRCVVIAGGPESWCFRVPHLLHALQRRRCRHYP